MHLAKLNYHHMQFVKRTSNIFDLPKLLLIAIQ